MRQHTIGAGQTASRRPGKGNSDDNGVNKPEHAGADGSPIRGLGNLCESARLHGLGQARRRRRRRLGVPIDTASSYRVGTRFGPRAIREMSMFHGFGPEGVFDFEDEVTYLTAEEVKIVDAGDSDVIYADTKRSLANAELA